MINILLYVSNGLIILAFMLYIFLLLIGNRKSVTKSNGFDITKDIISEYNSINVIESKSYLTVYNIKRKVIKLSSNCYYGNKLSDISLSLIEAAISVVDDSKNRYINLFRKIFYNLKLLYIFPILAICINYVSYNVSDAKVSMIFILLFSFITYMIVDIKSQAFLWISDNIIKIKDINNNNRKKIIDFINKLLFIDKLIFFGQLIIIIRLVAILLEIN